MEELKFTINDFAILLNERELSREVVSTFRNEEPLLYRNLNITEVNEVLESIKNKISNPETNSAGPEFKGNWEANWRENLDKFEPKKNDSFLIPNFIHNVSVLRFKGNYIMPITPNFEMRVVRILRTFLFEKFFANIDSLYEFGAGTGFNLVQFGEMFPDKKLFGYDWTDSSVKLISLAGKSKNLKIHSDKFDMFRPDFGLNIDRNSGLLTVGALEQLGTNWIEFLEFMLSKKFSIYMHIETNYEKNKKETDDFNMIASAYIERRNWLRGYFAKLEELETQGAIEIIFNKTIIGSKFHDSWNVTVWKLKNV